MIRVTHKGDFKNVEELLKRCSDKKNIQDILERYGKMGVDLLRDATPFESGETANSWDYEIESSDGEYRIFFTNSHENDGVNIAIILQYGHGTKNGGYVNGIDYINPAIKQTFMAMRDELVKEVRG